MKTELLVLSIILFLALALTSSDEILSLIPSISFNSPPLPTAPPSGNTPTPTRTPTPPLNPTVTIRPSNTPTVVPQLTALRTTVSGSKLGVFHLLMSPSGQEIIRGGPRIIKVIDPQSNSALMQLVRDYKRMYPAGIVVMRVYEGTPGLNLGSQDPTVAANAFWSQILQPALNKMQPSDKTLIDYLSGPNEFDQGQPLFTAPNAPAWYNTFWTQLATLISQNGYKPVLGDISVGWPTDIATQLPPLLPALRKINQVGGAWNYHTYTFNYSTDPNSSDAVYLSLRYRQYYSFFASNAPDLLSLKMILGEGGVAINGQGGSGYLNGNIGTFQSWLTWFDGQIRQDTYVQGVTLFQSGNTTDWSSFNVDSISNWLRDYLVSQ